MVGLSSRSHILLKALMEHFHPGAVGEVLAKALPIEKAQEISEINLPQENPQALLISPENALSKIHYSWIANAFKHFPKSLHPNLIAVLPKQHAKGLSDLLDIKAADKNSIAPVTQKFFLQNLYDKIDETHPVLPLEFLHTLPLSHLLDVDKNVLMEMFDILGLYDLATKMKVIIDKQTLLDIQKSLSPVKLKFLKVFLQQTDKANLPEIDLTDWTGDPNILKKLLHRRGIHRLSKAIAGYPKDFLWYLTHRLDTGRGEILKRYYSEEEAGISSALTEQVLFIINTLTQKKES